MRLVFKQSLTRITSTSSASPPLQKQSIRPSKSSDVGRPLPANQNEGGIFGLWDAFLR